jgi:hypothetical protein
MNGGMDVDPNIHRHWVLSPRKSVFWNATDATNPSIMPNAVHIYEESQSLELATCWTQPGTHLPHHRERATNVLGSRLGSVNRSGARLRSDSKAQSKTSDEQIDPVVGCGHPYAGNCTDGA